MKRSVIERNLVIFLFIIVLVTFSFAERDSKKLEKIYTTSELDKKGNSLIAEIAASISRSLN